MTKNSHDQFSKQYLKGMLSPFGEEVEISFELPPGEPQQVDVWFIPQMRQPVLELGMLGQMVTQPALLEVFRNPISENDLFACIEKLCRVRSELHRTCKREKRKLLSQDKPHLWLIVPTASEKTIESCNAKRNQKWGEGIFLMGAMLRIGFVVVHQLPVVPETLLLRLLGRGEVQKKAFAELLQLPEQPLKTFALEKFTKLRIMLKNSRTLSKDDRETMLNIDAIYDEWRNTAVQEGHRAGIVAMLIAKFGAIDTELEQMIPALLDMDPVERARSIMTLSREALVSLMGNES